MAVGKHNTVLSGNTDTHKMSATFKGSGKRQGHQDECCLCVFSSGRKMFFFVFLCIRNIGQWYWSVNQVKIEQNLCFKDQSCWKMDYSWIWMKLSLYQTCSWLMGLSRSMAWILPGTEMFTLKNEGSERKFALNKELKESLMGVSLY